MNKRKYLFTMVVVLILLCFTGCYIRHTVGYYETLQVKMDSFEYNNEAKFYYYDNAKDLEKLDAKTFGKYNEEFFRKKSLIVVTFLRGVNTEYKKIYFFGSTITIEGYFNEDEPQVSWTLNLEIDDKIQDIDMYRVEINDYIESDINEESSNVTNNYKK